MDTTNSPAQMQAQPFNAMLSGIATTSPGLYFFMKYWHVITITFLLLLMGILGFAAFKYNEYMSEKLLSVNVELAQYKDQNSILTENIRKIREDIEVAVLQRQQFELDIAEIKKLNFELRNRVNGLAGKIPPGTSSTEAQAIIDELRRDINQRWSTITERNDEK